MIESMEFPMDEVESQAAIIPKPGMGATMVVGRDRYPFTVVQVHGTGRVVVQEDHAKLVGGSCQSEHQVYEFSPNKESRLITLTKRQNGRWIEKGQALYGVIFYSIGQRSRYYDPT